MCRPARQGRAARRGRGLTVTFQMADAEALPFADASFDVVCPHSASCSPPITTRPPRSSCACAAQVGASAWPTGRRMALSARCSRPWARSAATGRREVACAVGHPRAARRIVRRAGASSIDANRTNSTSATGRPTISSTCSRPITGRSQGFRARSTRAEAEPPAR